jgi:hypothetical protein
MGYRIQSAIEGMVGVRGYTYSGADVVTGRGRGGPACITRLYSTFEIWKDVPLSP